MVFTLKGLKALNQSMHACGWKEETAIMKTCTYTNIGKGQMGVSEAGRQVLLAIEFGPSPINKLKVWHAMHACMIKRKWEFKTKKKKKKKKKQTLNRKKK